VEQRYLNSFQRLVVAVKNALISV